MDKQWQSCIQINPKYDGEKYDCFKFKPADEGSKTVDV